MQSEHPGGQGHWPGGWRAFLKRKIKKGREGKEREDEARAGFRAVRQPGGGSRGASRRARPRSVIYSCLFPMLIYIQEKKKLNQEIKTFSCQCLLRAWGRG